MQTRLFTPTQASLPLLALLLLTPSIALASGGWDGIGLVLALIAAPILLLLLLVLGLVLRLVKSPGVRRGVGVASLIVGVLCALWQVFYIGLELLGDPLFLISEYWTLVLLGLGSLALNALVFYLAWQLIRRQPDAATEG